jgi:hypothetical protein
VEELSWYSYGEQTQPTSTKVSMADIRKLAGVSYTTPSGQAKDLGNATGFLARARPESNRTVTLIAVQRRP